MNIEQINTSRILISLCNRDLEEYELTYETLDLKNDKARSVIAGLITAAEKSTGLPLHSGKLMIEAMKFDHGCILLITLLRRHRGRRYRITGRSDCYAFFFDESETMLSCMEQLWLAGERRHRTSLYLTHNGRYILICNTLPCRSFVRIAEEYASKILKGRLICAALREKSKCLIRSDAVRVCCCMKDK